MAAQHLRSAIGRATRRVVSEDFLTLFSRPRPNPGAAPSAAAEVNLLSKKADAPKKRWEIEFAESLVEEQKKKYESVNQEWTAIPFFTALSFAALFKAGIELGHDHRIRMYETQLVEESNN